MTPSGDYKDTVAAGILDPTKVVRVALQDAASVAGLLITTEAMVADRPEPKGAPARARCDRHQSATLARGFRQTRRRREQDSNSRSPRDTTKLQDA